jgi:hypothetical protein
LTHHERHESCENNGATGPVIPVPFLKIECPELDGFPSEERQRILQKCCQSPEMEQLSRRQMVVGRLAMVPLVLTILILIWGSNIGLQAKHLFWFGSFVMGLFIATFIGSIVVFQKRTSRLLKQLIAKEIARAQQVDQSN